MQSSIDWQFISDLEGGRHLKGYVPAAGRSGVTIATGIDLGARGAPDLEALDLPEHLRQCLTPYLGERGEAARRRLATVPLEITEQDAARLDAAVGARILARFARKFDRSRGRGLTPFDRLPAALQTVIASIIWQYGPNLDRPARLGGTPRFWRHITREDWSAAHAELLDFGDDYPTRRQKEAALLAAWLTERGKQSPIRDTA